MKEVIKRMFPKVVIDEVLKEYSWVGGKGKKKFSSLINLCNVVKGIVNNNFNNHKNHINIILIFQRLLSKIQLSNLSLKNLWRK